MKSGSRLFTLTYLILALTLSISGQDCIVLDSNSDFQKSQLCSPVDVTKWQVTFTGVNDAGTPVNIRFNWDDGVTVTLPASEGPDGVFTATSTHTYESEGDRCNYNARATLIVNGEVCEASAIETVVTVWDNDNENGGHVSASPDVYPVCFGNDASMHFDDNTRFNCVPPQEDDTRNESKRWIQFVYGTNHASANFMSSSTPPTVGGSPRTWPYEGPVVVTTQPIWSSSEQSLQIVIPDDNQIGDEFEVELRYWNYCNPYPGNPPVTDRSRIRIVDYPDPTINPVPPVCQFGTEITLSAATGGGKWTGDGIVNQYSGLFAPSVAGAGTHIIQYDVTDGNSCTATDTVAIEVVAAPEVNITETDPFCIYDGVYDLETDVSGGTWGGPGITDPLTGLFDPSIAGLGRHKVYFTSEADLNGCEGTDTAEIVVVDVPSAEFLTPDSVWCQQENNQTQADVLITGADSSSTFDLVIKFHGTLDTITGLTNGISQFLLDNQPGLNEYQLLKVIEHHGSNSCEQILGDILYMRINPNPELTLNAEYDDLCSPVDITFSTTSGYNQYVWDYGDGFLLQTNNSRTSHTYTFDFEDVVVDPLADSLEFFRNDTVFQVSVYAETEYGCSDTVNMEIPVYPVPEADFSAMPKVQDYPDSLVTLVNLCSPGNWDYSWDFGDDEGSTLKDPVEHVYPEYGIYTISLRVYNDHCSDTVSDQIQILPPPPVADFEPDTVGCPPLKVNFTNNSLYADTYIWDFDDGTFSAEANPSHIFFDNRDHTVTMAVFGLSGSDTVTRTVSVYTPPQAIFEVYPTSARNLKQTFKFTNKSVNGSYYLWDFGDGYTSPAEEPSHIYGEEGTYTVTLYAWSVNNCADTMEHKDLIKITAGEGSVDFPTAFVFDPSSKGGNWEVLSADKINTVFRPAVINVREFKMIIYTRWGEKIFETNEYSIGWDGYMRNGQVAKEGVYLWKAWVKYVDGAEEVLAGDITFLH